MAFDTSDALESRRAYISVDVASKIVGCQNKKFDSAALMAPPLICILGPLEAG